MIKIATQEDHDQVLSLVQKRADEIFSDFMNSPQTEKIILVNDDDGILVGMCLSFGEYKLATDVLWFVDPVKRHEGMGSELLDAFEFWANRVGCNLIMITSLNPSGNKEYFEEKGYQLKSMAYVKYVENTNGN